MSLAPADEDSGPLPRRFGAYTLVALLGRGGMGEVFLAMRGGIEGIARRCVVKTLRPAFTEDREYVGRFLDEARVVVQLHHRNICPVFDVGRVDGRYYLAMEYIAGRDLRTVCARLQAAGRPLHEGAGVGLALHIIAEVLEALEHAHTLLDPATGAPLLLVHRDVSPHNVMIGFDGDVRLIDFGLAASTLKAEHTAPNVVMGKVAYMSPEQICGDPLDAAADQFSAAVMATELLTCERFYAGLSNREVYALAATGGFRPPGLARLPDGLRSILDRALAAERGRRWPSCGAMRAALDAWRYDAGLRGDGPGLQSAVREVLAAEIVAERQLLSDAAVAAGLPADGLSTRPAPTAPGLPSDTERHPRFTEDVGATVSAASAPAFLSELPPTMGAAAPPRRWPRVAAGLGLAAVLIGLVVVATTRTDDGVTTPTPTPAPSPVAVAPPVATPAPPIVEPIAPVEPAPVATPAPPPPPTTPRTTGPAPSPAPMPSVVPKPVPTPAPTTTRPRRPPPPPVVRVGARLTWLRTQCPTLACAGPVLADEARWLQLEPGAMAAFKTRLHACVDECAGP
jgi:tRNA A-37 threonylcarbamoyl transferase component Bud32